MPSGNNSKIVALPVDLQDRLRLTLEKMGATPVGSKPGTYGLDKDGFHIIISYSAALPKLLVTFAYICETKATIEADLRDLNNESLDGTHSVDGNAYFFRTHIYLDVMSVLTQTSLSKIIKNGLDEAARGLKYLLTLSQ